MFIKNDKTFLLTIYYSENLLCIKLSGWQKFQNCWSTENLFWMTIFREFNFWHISVHNINQRQANRKKWATSNEFHQVLLVLPFMDLDEIGKPMKRLNHKSISTLKIQQAWLSAHKCTKDLVFSFAILAFSHLMNKYLILGLFEVNTARRDFYDHTLYWIMFVLFGDWKKNVKFNFKMKIEIGNFV